MDKADLNPTDEKVRFAVFLRGDALSVHARNPDGTSHNVHADVRDRFFQVALFEFLRDYQARPLLTDEPAAKPADPSTGSGSTGSGA